MSGEYSRALIELKNAVQAAPENARARFLLGQAYLEAGNADGALKELTRARSNGMSDDALNVAIVKAMIRSGKTGEAATELAINFVESNATWLSLHGILDLAGGRYEEAHNALEQAVKLDPENLQKRIAGIRAAIALGTTDDARRYIDDALTTDIADAEIWALKGDLDSHDKNYAGAVASYSKSLEVFPNNSIILLRRAAAHTSNQNPRLGLEDLDAMGDVSNESP
ncbi:MAG: tetratricopeptide repeat protein [Gammaproteobacteria bacterium]